MHRLTAAFHRPWLALSLVVVAAALLRLNALGVVEFSHDEATLSLLALDLARGKALPLTGMQSSVGVPNSPASVYLLALPYRLTNDPLLATGFVAALNVGGVALLWLLVVCRLGHWPALVSGLIYAANTWAVLYSRKIWAQNLHTPFLILALLLGLQGFGERRGWAQVWCLPVLLIAAQIHFAAWSFVPLYLLLLMLFRHNLMWSRLVLSAALGAATLLPFALGLLKALAENPHLASALASSGLAPSPFPLHVLLWFTTSTGLEHVVAPLQTEAFLRACQPPTLLWIGALGGSAVLGAVWLWRAHQRLALLIVAWALLPVLCFLPGWTSVYPHYFIGSIPALCVLAACGVTLFPNRPLRWALMVATSAALLTQLNFWSAALRYVDSTFTPTGFGTPLRFLRDVRDKIPMRDHVLVIADGFDRRYDREPVIWSVLLYDTAQCVRTLAGSAMTLYPAYPSTVLVAPDAPANLPHLLIRPAALRDRLPLRPGEGSYSIYQLASLASPSDLTLAFGHKHRFDNGVRFIGYRLQPDYLALGWLLPGPAQLDYHSFVHYLDAAGHKLAQTDGPFWPSYHWCAGDVLFTHVALPPEGTTTLRVGLYVLGPDGTYTNAAVIDDSGIPLALWIDVPLLSAPHPVSAPDLPFH